MAEGLLSGILGEEDEKAEVETPDAMAGAESFASAVAAKLAGNDPEVARRTSDFLIDQSQLLRVQKEHLEQEHAARLHFLQGQAREVDLRRFGLRLRVCLESGSDMTSTSTATWLRPRRETLRSRSAATACRRRPSLARPRGSRLSPSRRPSTSTRSPSRRAGPRISRMPAATRRRWRFARRQFRVQTRRSGRGF